MSTLQLLGLLILPCLVYAGTRPSFVSDKMIATAATVVNACQSQTGVTTADIELVRNGEWPDSMELKFAHSGQMFFFFLGKEDAKARTFVRRIERIYFVRQHLQKDNNIDEKCYMYCLWEQFGLIDEKQELSLNGMLTFFQRIPAYRNEVQKAISECKALATGDTCEYAYTFNKCYAERSPRTYYLF